MFSTGRSKHVRERWRGRRSRRRGASERASEDLCPGMRQSRRMDDILSGGERAGNGTRSIKGLDERDRSVDRFHDSLASNERSAPLGLALTFDVRAGSGIFMRMLTLIPCRTKPFRLLVYQLLSVSSVDSCRTERSEASLCSSRSRDYEIPFVVHAIP